MSYHSNQRAMASCQARYDNMTPDDDDMPEPEDVDEKFHRWECPECHVIWGVEDDEHTIVIDGDTYCTECLVDGVHPVCELTVNYEAWQEHMDELRGEAIAEYGIAHVRRCERRN